MRSQPYRFRTDVQYLARVACAGERTLPSADGQIRLIKVVLATPYYFEGVSRDRKPSSEHEAAIWWVAGSGGETRRLLLEAGVINEDGELQVLTRSPWLLVKFGEKKVGRYQPITEYELLPPGRYPQEDLVVEERRVSGLSRHGTLLQRAGYRDVELGKRSKVSWQLFDALNSRYPERVSMRDLRKAVESWREKGVEDQTVNAAVSDLNILLHDLGASISGKLGDEGWALVVS